MRLLVGEVRVAVWLKVVDEDGHELVVELELEVMLELELDLEAELVLLKLWLVLLALLETAVLEVWVVASVEVGTPVELGTVTEPSVVGAPRVAGVSVKLNVKLGRLRSCVIPVAVANTLVARSLAVPQPNWKNRPSKTFL
jgi:hypothetical protein